MPGRARALSLLLLLACARPVPPVVLAEPGPAAVASALLQAPSVGLIAAAEPTKHSACHAGSLVLATGHPDGVLWEVFRSEPDARARLDALRAARQ